MTQQEMFWALRWNAAADLRRLLDALLAPEPALGTRCSFCDRVTQPGEILRVVGSIKRDPLVVRCATCSAPAAEDHARREIDAMLTTLLPIPYEAAQQAMWRRMARDQAVAALANWSA